LTRDKQERNIWKIEFADLLSSLLFSEKSGGVSEYVPATPTDAILAEVLRNQHQLKFFDALYIATAKNLDKPLLSNDENYPAYG